MQYSQSRDRLHRIAISSCLVSNFGALFSDSQTRDAVAIGCEIVQLDPKRVYERSLVFIEWNCLTSAMRFWTLCFRFFNLLSLSMQKSCRHKSPSLVCSWRLRSIAYSSPSLFASFSSLPISLSKFRTFDRSRSLCASRSIMSRDNTWSSCE